MNDRRDGTIAPDSIDGASEPHPEANPRPPRSMPKTARATVLVVDDEEEICDLVSYNLAREGYRVVQEHDGEAGLNRVFKSAPDLLILDLLLPKMSGLEVLGAIRGEPRTRSLPVLVLTARGTEMDKLVGFERGADDYLTKPFSPKELVARVQAILRRTRGEQAATPVKVGPFQFDSEVSLHEVVAEAVGMVGEDLSRRRIQVVNEVAPGLPRLRVDHPKLRKLFQLLLRDELANLQEGATIRFEASAREAQDGQPAGIDLLIHDNGPGLPKDAILAVFDPFFVRNDSPNEFGIYLMACYFIVYHHGGTINVGPGKEGGLAFRIMLPLHPVAGSAIDESEDFLVRVMTNERLWERLLATA